MLKGRKSVLDEREMLEMYRVEHFGLWLMYGLLCIAVIVQMLGGASRFLLYLHYTICEIGGVKI